MNKYNSKHTRFFNPIIQHCKLIYDNTLEQKGPIEAWKKWRASNDERAGNSVW